MYMLCHRTKKYVLLAFDIVRVYRHSFRARYKIYDRYSQNANKLIDCPASQDGDWKEKYIQFAGWGTVGNALVFVYNNNLYYQADPHSTSNPITSSGGPLVYNAIPDWVYEEEILHSNAAHWWSPDATYVAFAHFDDRNVPLYHFPYYGPLTSHYGDMEDIPYPKAGDPRPFINPKVKVYLMETRNTRATQKELKVPAQLANQEHYLTMVAWQDDNHVLIAWSNRPQNMSIITICDATSADCYVNQIEIAREGGWVQIPQPIFIHGGQRYLMVLSEQDANHGYWKHIAMVTTPIGREGQRTYLTQGTWDVTDLVAFDPGERSHPGYVYFISTNRDPRKRHLFRVEMVPDRDRKLKVPECLTCEMDELCQYVNVKFSANGKYYILTCEGPGVPEVILKSTVDDRHVFLEDNAELKERLKDKAVPKEEYFELELKDGTTIWVQVYLPPVLNKEHITQYPLLIHTYGGPGTQKVTEQFQINWMTYLTTSQNFIYASIDGRGSGARGDRFLHAVHRRLGTLEVQDQIAGAVYLRDHLHYVDKERIAIWGWSYGGFLTAHALGDRDNDIFKCGIAVAPVTDWRYYDTVYTERFMGMSHDDNYRGYDNANVSAKAANFKGKKFMLVHGTADDNVHFQHTAQLVKALTDADVDFRVQMYTDKNPRRSKRLEQEVHIH
jgi:dipeptidyl-peptidase-4